MNLLLSILNESRTFLEILQDEWIGMLASAFILVSFLFTKQMITRLVNMGGCIVFVIYGVLLPSYSTALMNFALLIVHIVYLTKDFLAHKKSKQASQEPKESEMPNDDVATSDTATIPDTDQTTAKSNK